MNDDLNGLLAKIQANKNFVDDKLFAAGCFIYRNNPRVRKVMREWWYYVSRYHTNDQLSLPYVIWKKVSFRITDENFLNSRYLKFLR